MFNLSILILKLFNLWINVNFRLKFIYISIKVPVFFKYLYTLILWVLLIMCIIISNTPPSNFWLRYWPQTMDITTTIKIWQLRSLLTIIEAQKRRGDNYECKSSELNVNRTYCWYGTSILFIYTQLHIRTCLNHYAKLLLYVRLLDLQ